MRRVLPSTLRKTIVLSALAGMVVLGLPPLTPQVSPQARPAADLACLRPDIAKATVVNAPAAQTATYQAALDPGLRQPRTIEYSGARLVIGAGAVSTPMLVGITPLADAGLPPLNPGLVNVTKGSGYEFSPRAHKFATKVQVAVPYDPALVGRDFSPQDVHTYAYDEQSACWRQLERVSGRRAEPPGGVGDRPAGDHGQRDGHGARPPGGRVVQPHTDQGHPGRESWRGHQPGRAANTEHRGHGTAVLPGPDPARAGRDGAEGGFAVRLHGRERLAGRGLGPAGAIDHSGHPVGRAPVRHEHRD
jgi:hypothetical protein